MHTVIVGGGFAGVKAALELSKKQLGKITLISDQPYFLHHATLYATATGRSTRESVVPLEDIFARHHDVDVVLDSMKSIDPVRKMVVGKSRSYNYDNLIIAIGVVTSYFGIRGMARNSFGIKTLEEVKEFKNHLHQELTATKHLDKNYVIIGGGPTGVELAGSLSEYLRDIAKSHHLRHGKVKITLVEASPRLLPRLSKTASKRVLKRLEDLGVRVLTNHKVESLGKEFVTIDGKKVPTETAIWTSGVTNHPFFKEHEEYFQLAPNGRVEVNQYLEAYRNIYVIGDNANVSNVGQARPALDSAKFIADHIARKATARLLKSYVPKIPPSGIPVGSNWAYVEWNGIYADGKTGHHLRRLIELTGYKALLPHNQALSAWRAHDIKEESCKLCKTEA